MCNRIKGIMLSEDFRQGFTTLVRIRCEMWGCPDCGPINAQRWRAYLLKRFNEAFGHENWCFCTITAHRKAHVSPEMSIRNLQQVWKKLYDRIRRRYAPKKVQYIRVFEPHKSGRFHMHFLMNTGDEYDACNFVAESVAREFRHPECIWMRKASVSCGGGWRVHMRRVWDSDKRTANVGLVVGYVLKYMGKQMSDFEFPKHQRRIQTSRKIGSPDTGATGRGTWVHMRELPESALLNGRKIVDMTTGEVLTRASFEGEGYYPPLRYYRGENSI